MCVCICMRGCACACVMCRIREKADKTIFIPSRVDPPTLQKEVCILFVWFAYLNGQVRPGTTRFSADVGQIRCRVLSLSIDAWCSTERETGLFRLKINLSRALFI